MSRRTAVIATLCVAVAAVLGLIIVKGGGHGSHRLTAPDIERINQLLATGQQQRLDGQLVEAESSFNEILAIDSTNDLARFNLAQMMQNRNDFAGAAKEFGKVIATRPDMEEAQIGYAVCLRDSDRVDDAIEHLRVVVAKYPSVLKYQLLLGRLLVRQGEFDEGDRLVGGVLRIDSTLENWNP